MMPAATAPLLTGLPLAYRLVNPETAGHVQRLLLVLHGVGSNEVGMLPVGQALADEHTLVLLVQAPLPLGPNAFGFYQVDFSTGKPEYNRAQQEASQQQLTQFIDEATARYGVVAGQVYLLGFSQGAIMAYAVALRTPALVAGVLGFSGRMLAESRQHHAPAEQVQRVRFFISHGSHDTTLPAIYATEAVDFLRSLGIEAHYEAFAGAHEIPAASLAAARHWLAAKS